SFWRNYSNKQNEFSLVSRRRTIAHWRTARVQARYRNVTRKISGNRHSCFHSRHARSTATWPGFSPAPSYSCDIRQTNRHQRTKARGPRRETASKDRERSPGERSQTCARRWALQPKLSRNDEARMPNDEGSPPRELRALARLDSTFSVAPFC